MYLMINGNRHTCSRRIKTADTIKFLSVTPAVEEISGTVYMYRNDGFLLSCDNLDNYERKSYVGTLLTATNALEPVPVDPTTTTEYRLSALEQASQDQDALLVDYEYRLTLMELGVE